MAEGVFYERFKKLLDQKGCKTHDVAVATGIPDASFSDWKKGRCNPKADKVLLICNFFGVNLEYFYS